MKRSASEAGLDDRHIKVLSDITRPPLFPDFLWKSTGHYWNEEDLATENKPQNPTQLQPQQQPIKTESSPSVAYPKQPASLISMINKQRELTKRFQNSSYYIRPNTIVDIVRYSDRMESHKSHRAQPSTSADVAVLASLSVCARNARSDDKIASIAANDTKYFPEELLPIKKKSKLIQRRKLSERVRSDLNNATADVAIKLEKWNSQEESGKIRTTSITSLASNDDLMLTVPPPTTTKARKSSDADETILGDIDIDDDDEEEDDNNDNLLEENVEEELGEDYTTNYYASEDENNDDDDNNGDGEPTY
jgi:hypothetical protein